jgi:hypothetical protein
MPFLHANRIFTITFVEDLTFSEVRGILDYLLAEAAFDPDVQEVNGYYEMEVDRSSFHVWVSEMDVIIQRV